MVPVRVELRAVAAFEAVPNRKRVETEHLAEHAQRFGVALRDVDPEPAVFAREQSADLGSLTLLRDAVCEP